MAVKIREHHAQKTHADRNSKMWSHSNERETVACVGCRPLGGGVRNKSMWLAIPWIVSPSLRVREMAIHIQANLRGYPNVPIYHRAPRRVVVSLMSESAHERSIRARFECIHRDAGTRDEVER